MSINSDWLFKVVPAVDCVGLTAVCVHVFIQSNLPRVYVQLLALNKLMNKLVRVAVHLHGHEQAGQAHEQGHE